MKKLIQTIFLNYIRTLAKLQLAKIRPKIIGVTGSEGKTSTTYAIKLALESKYQVKKTEKANSETGIPFDILGLEVKSYSILNWVKLSILALWKLLTNWKKYDVYIVEMGIDSPFEPKNMGYLLKILIPDIAVLTSISSVHAGYFEPLLTDNQKKLDNKERMEFLRYEITKEKGKMVKAALAKGGDAIANIDNKFIEKFVIDEKLDIHTVTIENIDNYRLLQIKSVRNTTEGFIVKYRLGERELVLHIKDILLGEEFAYTFGFAIQVADILKINPQTAIKNLTQYKSPPGRFKLLNGIKNSKIIDSSYNSSPVSLEQALTLFAKLESKGRKLVVLGDMRELGEIEAEEHTKLAQIAAQLHFDEYLLLGKNMTSHFKEELVKQGLDLEEIHTFKHALEVGEFLKDNIQENDMLLVKGSQNTIFLEEAIKKILKNSKPNPLDPSPLLCRQSKWWLETKGKYFKSL